MRKGWAAAIISIDLVILVIYLILSQINHASLSERINNAIFVMFPLVGAILITRHPRNPVGYITATIGFSVLGGGTLFEYASLSRLLPAVWVPLADEAGWLSMVSWTLTYPSLVLLLLHFPNGQVPGPRWRVLSYFTLLSIIPVLVGNLLVAWPYRHRITQEFAEDVAPDTPLGQLLELYNVWYLVLTGAVVLALFSFIVRYARSRGADRQQLKWFVYGLSTIPVSLILGEIFSSTENPLLIGFAQVLNILSVIGFPVILLIAITRYRLYDIDVIIRRTLLYSSLTLILGTFYLGMVLLMQWLFAQYLGQQPTLIVVLSTMLIAALFQPLRMRLQQLIDQRFYRKKLNAERMLEQFNAAMQNEVNPDAIQSAVIGFVHETLRPAHTELWLFTRAPGPPAGR